MVNGIGENIKLNIKNGVGERKRKEFTITRLHKCAHPVTNNLLLDCYL